MSASPVRSHPDGRDILEPIRTVSRGSDLDRRSRLAIIGHDGAVDITPYESADQDRLVAVWESSVRATHDFLTETDIAAIRPLVRDALPQVPRLAVLRVPAGPPTGFIGGADRKVHMLFLQPGLRGQGWGRRLLEFAITRWNVIELDVNEQNPDAVGFYQHLGFETVGRSDQDDAGKPYPILHMRLQGGR